MDLLKTLRGFEASQEVADIFKGNVAFQTLRVVIKMFDFRLRIRLFK